MISAHIEMDLNQHISVISSKILQLIDSSEDMILETLMRKFLKQYEFYTPDQFIDGVAFLHAMNCLSVEDYKVVISNV